MSKTMIALCLLPVLSLPAWTKVKKAPPPSPLDRYIQDAITRSGAERVDARFRGRLARGLDGAAGDGGRVFGHQYGDHVVYEARARVAAEVGASPRTRADPRIRAGLRIAAGGNVVDGTLDGLLADREEIGARLLHAIEVAEVEG